MLLILPGRGGVTTAVGCLLACLCVWVGTAAASPSEPAAPRCGPVGTVTLATKGSVRIYEVSADNDASGKNVRVCSSALPRPAPLGRGPVAAPFSIAFPWTAGVEARLVGQDTAQINVVAVNLSTHRKVSCFVGEANRPGQIPKVKDVWATSGGSVAILANMKLYPAGPELAVCSGRTLKVIARGASLDAGSVSVVREVLSWTDQGQRHTRHL